MKNRITPAPRGFVAKARGGHHIKAGIGVTENDDAASNRIVDSMTQPTASFQSDRLSLSDDKLSFRKSYS